jgi:uncharacterized protein YkwD
LRALPPGFLLLAAAALVTASPWHASADTRTERAGNPTAPAGRAGPGATAESSASATLPSVLQEVIELTNRERLKAGLPALKRQQNLLESAGWLARDMASNGFFDHRDSTRREMATRLTDFRYTGYHALGENIAMGQRTPAEVVNTWMNSPGHRANILSRSFTEIGVGYVPPSARNAYGYWVEDFGSRFDQCAAVIGADADRTDSSRVLVSIHVEDWAAEMRLSNDARSWSEWQPIHRLCEWSLAAGRGKRTVYVELRRDNRVERVEAAVLVEGGPAAALASNGPRGQ